MTAVLIVCLGNICRSPAGESILTALARKESSIDLQVESCGTGDWNLGRPPDSRMQEVAKARGWTLTGVARGIRDLDFERFDYILAVDHEILHVLQLKAPTQEQRSKIHLMSDFSPAYQGQNIPDPFHGDVSDFVRAVEMLEDACRGFLIHLLGR